VAVEAAATALKLQLGWMNREEALGAAAAAAAAALATFAPKAEVAANSTLGATKSFWVALPHPTGEGRTG